MGDSMGRGGTMGHAGQQAHMQDAHEAMDWSNLTQAQRDAALDKADHAQLFARFTASGGVASGRFVSFGYDTAAGRLSDYTAVDLNRTVFFQQAHVEGWGGNVSEDAHGAVWHMSSDTGMVRAHNNPTAQLAVRGANVTVHLDLGAGFLVAPGAVPGATLTLTNANGQHGHVFIAGNGTLALLTNTTLQANLTDGALVFLAHPKNTSLAADLHDRINAIATGALGAEVSVVAVDGKPAEDAESFGVTVVAETPRNNTVRIHAASDDHRGRAIVVRTDNTTLGPGAPVQITVSVNGVPVAHVANASAAVLAATAGAGAAYVNFTNGGFEVVVAVPSFSEQVVEIQGPTQVVDQNPPPPPPPSTPPATPPASPPASPPSSGTPGFEAFLAVTAFVVAVAMRRR